jgi:hypothetical protein
MLDFTAGNLVKNNNNSPIHTTFCFISFRFFALLYLDVLGFRCFCFVLILDVLVLGVFLDVFGKTETQEK